jgi:hypothetical protein
MLLALCTSSIFINAQVKTKTFYEGIPEILKPAKGLQVKEYIVSNPKEFDARLSESETLQTNFNYNFAISVPVSIDVLNNAALNTSADKITYHFRLKAGSAKNVSLEFGKFHLSTNAVLSVYT